MYFIYLETSASADEKIAHSGVSDSKRDNLKEF